MFASQSAARRLSRHQCFILRHPRRRVFSSNNNNTNIKIPNLKTANTKPPPPPRNLRIDEEPETILVDDSIRMKNNVMGVALACFCVGVAWYSMNAVGQAGSTSDDPLAALKQEAAAAQKVHDQQAATESNVTEMLEKFNKGEYDPDVQELNELEERQQQSQTKKPWWKFWAKR